MHIYPSAHNTSTHPTSTHPTSTHPTSTHPTHLHIYPSTHLHIYTSYIPLALCHIMMKVYQNLRDLPVFKNAIVTIGTFDGVHLGHQQIIKLLKEEAHAVNGESVIITFHPHPRKVLARGTGQVKIINTLTEKVELLEKQEIAHLAVVEFNDEFAKQTAEEYVEHFLVEKFHPHTIIIGYDHRFGSHRSGDYKLLENLGLKFGYKVKEIPEHILNDVIISSTKIREALIHSSIETANAFLGYAYFFTGKVIQGSKIGRTIGYPTANLQIDDAEKLIPGNGVYAVTVQLQADAVRYQGMMNIGNRPTVNGTQRTIEINIFSFDLDIYGKQLTVHVHHYLREEIKFAGLEQLIQQLALDKFNAEKLLLHFTRDKIVN